MLVSLSEQSWASQYAAEGRDGIVYRVSEEEGLFEVEISGVRHDTARLFLAVGATGKPGSKILPFGRNVEGSTVFLPFNASAVVSVGRKNATLRLWTGTQWGNSEPVGNRVRVIRSGETLMISMDRSIFGTDGPVRLAAFFKEFPAGDEWGRLFSSIDPNGPSGSGDAVFRRFLLQGSKSWALTKDETGDDRRVRIYQFLPRHFGNTNETRKTNGTIEENGTGKFADINATSLAELKRMGFTHLWPTGVIQQATATDYSAVGEPADDPDLLKGLAGSPYAIKDYYDVSPDYAVDPARRLEEFREMVSRIHEAGLKVIIDFVPNHVARSYSSSVRPDQTFGEKDRRDVYFHPDNNFFWLTPEAKPFGKGPPLRLPTVDAEGRPVSPTVKVSKVPGDGLFQPEREHGRVTGSNLASWEPDMGSWYETVKLNYGYDFLDRDKKTRAYPHGSQPDLKIPNTWLKMDEIIAYWQGLGVDGFRVDMAHMVPPEFWHWMIARARARNPGVFFAAEAYDTDPAKVPSGDPLVAEVGGGNVMFDLLNAGFDAVYDDATYDKLKEIFERDAWANDLDRIAAHPFVAENSLRYAENHDEVRLAGKGVWGNVGAAVGRPVTALLFALSRGPVMLYSGQEVGEPADGVEGFGEDDARTSIFDYWSMPEFTKWVNKGSFDGGKLSEDQKSLRDFYSRLLGVVGEPAFRDGDLFALNPANIENPRFGRLSGEPASGRWLYAFVRRDPAGGQTFLVVVNLHPTQALNDVGIRIPQDLLQLLGTDTEWTLVDRLERERKITVRREDAARDGLAVGSLPPLSAAFFELATPSKK